MDLVTGFMNLVAPPFTFFTILLFLPPWLFFRFCQGILNSIFTEDVSGKVILITGASSGIGEGHGFHTPTPQLGCTDRNSRRNLLPLTTLSPFQAVQYIVRSISKENVAGKMLLIVGASSGIGKHLAYEYARRGACLVLAARRKNSLREVASTALLLGSPDAIAIRTDVSNVDDCKRLIDETINRYGRLDHLVNCAGVTPVCMLEETTDITRLRQVTDINFWGYVYATYFAVPHLRRNKGRIVVIASSASWLPAPRMSLYNASKAAAVSFYETLRLELGSDIGITMVTHGLIESEMTKGKFIDKDGQMVVDQELRDAEISILPIELVVKCAMAVVNSACRGDNYLAEPYWIRMTAYWVAAFPELIEWLNHWFLRAEPGASPEEAPSKKILDLTGLKYILYPPSLWSPDIKLD